MGKKEKRSVALGGLFGEERGGEKGEREGWEK